MHKLISVSLDFPKNIKYMRKFVLCWPNYEIVQRVVAQFPWRTNWTLLDKLDTAEGWRQYAQKVIEKWLEQYNS